jgi:hypothetical protein
MGFEKNVKLNLFNKKPSYYSQETRFAVASSLVPERYDEIDGDLNFATVFFEFFLLRDVNETTQHNIMLKS